MSDDYLSQPLNISSGGECKLSQIWNWTSLNIRFEFSFVEKSSSAPSSSSSSSLFSSPSRQQSVNAFSPYLNYDPRLLQQSQPEFIFPEGASKQRGRFELAFSQIGSAVMVWSNILCYTNRMGIDFFALSDWCWFGWCSWIVQWSCCDKYSQTDGEIAENTVRTNHHKLHNMQAQYKLSDFFIA